MFDFTKIQLPVCTTSLILEKEGSILHEHAQKKDTLAWHNLELFVNPKDHSSILSGSVHKLYNQAFTSGGYANFTDFSFNQWIDTCILLSEDFHINPFTATLRNLEIGVNIVPAQKAYDVVRAVKTHKNDCPQDIRHYGRFKKFKLQRYSIKLYDKGNQYRIEGYRIEKEILRVEVAVKKMAHLRRYGIETLSDILNPVKVLPLLSLLTQAAKDFQVDPSVYSFPELTRPEQKVIEILTDKNLTKPNIKYYNRRLSEILDKYNIPDLRVSITEAILDKWKELTEIDEKIYTKLTTYLKDFPEYEKSDFCESLKKAILYQINHSSIELKMMNGRLEQNLIKPEFSESLKKEKPEESDNLKKGVVAEHRFCKSCGKEITHQQGSSIFCSAKYVGEKTAKECRNKDSNSRNNLKSKIQRLQNGDYLFNQLEYLKI